MSGPTALILNPLHDYRLACVGLCLRPVGEAEPTLAELCSFIERVRGRALPSRPLMLDCGERWLLESGGALPAEDLIPVLPALPAEGSPLAAALARLRGDGGRPAFRGGAAGAAGDLLVLPAERIGPLLPGAGRHALIAVDLDGEAAARRLLALGCRYLRFGRLLRPPGSRDLRTSAHTALLQLIAMLGQDADSGELESVFRREARLAFDLLRLVNSAANHQRTRVSSFRHAIELLGRRQLLRWLQLMLFTQPRAGGERPELLLHRAAWRGRLMELLAEQSGGAADVAFMTGVLSLLEPLLGLPLPTLLRPLALDERVTAALLAGEGALAPLLRLAEQLEQPEAGTLADLLAGLRLPADALCAAQLAAWEWVFLLGSEP